MANPTRILVVDDHAIVRQGLRAIIDPEPDLSVCGEADGVPDAMRQLSKVKPDLALVDLSLREGTGLDLIGRIHERLPKCRILVLSMHKEDIYAARALRAGASGYVHKQLAPDTVLVAIRDVMAGNTYLSPGMGERTKVDEKGGDVGSLSDRELSVFELIGEGVGTRLIAERLRLSVKTIETYREHIKSKLGLRNAAELSREAVQWRIHRENS